MRRLIIVFVVVLCARDLRATVANLRFDVTALHYAALSLVLSILAISFAASLALVTRRSE